MRDVFGRKLMRLFQEKNTNMIVAAWTKDEASDLLLTNTNSFSTVIPDLKSIRNCGYSGIVPKIL